MDEERIARLRLLLEQNHKWPGVYMFKFVLENEPSRLSQLKLVFGETAEFKVRFSAAGKYASITVRELIMDSEMVFERYMAAHVLGGITAL